jgi:hypothetical protein
MQLGDVIIEVNREKVESVREFKEMLKKYEKISLLVKRPTGGFRVIQLV